MSTKCEHCGRTTEPTKDGSCAYCGAPVIIQQKDSEIAPDGYNAELKAITSKSFEVGYTQGSSNFMQEITKSLLGVFILSAIVVGAIFVVRYISGAI